MTNRISAFLALAAVIGLAQPVEAAPEATAADDICNGPHGRYWQQTADAEPRPAFERFICLLTPQEPAKPAEFVGKATDIGFAPAIDIAFQSLPDAVLNDVPNATELVETLNFARPAKIDFTTFSNLAQPASLLVGETAVWMVTPGGLRVFDSQSRRWSFSAKLGSDEVRPRDAVIDEKSGSIWFFGRDLYQYDIAAHRIFRHKAPAKTYRVIRKIAPAAGGVWMATDAGIFRFDTRRKVMQQLHAEAKALRQGFSQVAAGANSVWFASGDAQIVSIRTNGDKFAVRVSKPLAALPPIELVARDDGLWFLHTQDHGRSYQLATIPAEGSSLLASRVRAFNLRESDGAVFASAYDELFRIDTAARRLAPIHADIAAIGALALGKRVLFSGASYVNSRSTGSVGRYIVDLSKGWQKPAARLYYEGWAEKQSREIFNYIPALLETAGNRNEVWFLIAGNLDNPYFDRSFAARYDKRSGRAEVFFSRWSPGNDKDAAPGADQPFSVQSLATTPTRP